MTSKHHSPILRPTSTPHSFVKVYNKWNREIEWLRPQIEQVRTTFQKAAFILSKGDFDRLAVMESLQAMLQQKIELFIEQLKHHLWEPHGSGNKSLDAKAYEIENELALLVRRLADLKRDRFTKKKKLSSSL